MCGRSSHPPVATMSISLRVLQRLPAVSALLRRHVSESVDTAAAPQRAAEIESSSRAAQVEIDVLRSEVAALRRRATLADDTLRDLITSKTGKLAREAVPELRPWCTAMASSTNGMSVDASGDVTTCCYDSLKQNKLGNVYEDGIAEIWRRFNAAVLGDLYDLPACRTCVGSGVPWAPPIVCPDRRRLEAERRAKVRAFPERVILEPAALCNYACDLCPANTNAKVLADLDRLYAGLEPGLPHLGFMAFGLYGEPLLHKGLPGFIRRCRAAAPRLVMQLLTNGTALTASVAAKLVDAGVDIVTVAIHGGPSTENMLKYSKRGADYELVLKNIHGLVAARDARPDARTMVEVRTVLFHWNDTDDLMDRLRADVAAAGVVRRPDRLYWVLDVAGAAHPRSSKRFLPGSADLEALKARGEFSAC